MKMKSKFDWVRNRANEDINKLLLVYACKQKELAILSVDMQNIFLDYIYPNFKREILEIYHKEIKTVCKKNDILFKEIKFKVRDKKVNSESRIIDVSHLSNGVYIVEVSTSNTVIRKEFVISNENK